MTRRLSTFNSPWWVIIVIVIGGARQQIRDIHRLFSNTDGSSVTCGDEAPFKQVTTPTRSSNRGTARKDQLDGDHGLKSTVSNKKKQPQDLLLANNSDSSSATRGRQPSNLRKDRLKKPTKQGGMTVPTNSSTNSLVGDRKKRKSSQSNESALASLANSTKSRVKSPNGSSDTARLENPTTGLSDKPGQKMAKTTTKPNGIPLLTNRTGIRSSLKQTEPTKSTKIQSSERATEPLVEPPATSAATWSDEPSCYISIENKADYHYEVIESTILQIPLNWTKLGCDTTKGPIHFDIALAFNDKFNQAEGERQGWAQYYHDKLEGRILDRADGTMARIGGLVNYANYTRGYNAIVGISCDSFAFKPWLKRINNAYCILHKECTNCADWLLDRTCYLTPMYDQKQCAFVPSRLPKFDNRPPPVPTLDICISGGGGLSTRRDFGLLADALARLKPEGVKVTLYQRIEAIPNEFYAANVTDYVQVNRVPGYVEFHEAVSKCHILLPLVSPTSGGKEYFELKRLSGSIPVMTSHKLPAVIHTDFEAIYHDYLTAPVKVYNDSDTFAVALHEMIDDVRNSYKSAQ